MRRLRLLSLAGVTAGLMLGMGVLALGQGAQAQSSPEETVGAAVEAWNAEDAEAFMSYFTEDGFAALVGPDFDDPMAFFAEVRQEIGAIVDYEVSDLTLSGGAFTAIVEITFEAGFSNFEMWTFVQSDGEWKIDALEEASRPTPPGVPTVDLTLQEYAFVYNDAAINAADGNFAFSVTNVGEEEHEVLVFQITGEGSLLEILESSGPDEEPEGVEFVAFGGFFQPGGSGTVVFDQPLGPGRYGMVCFVPSPDDVPHAFLGMVSEFTVGGGPVDSGSTSGGSITPPSTGNAGLLGADASASWLLVPVLAVVLAGAALIRAKVAAGI